MSPVTEAGGLGLALTPEQWSTFVLDHLSAQSVLIASGATVIRTNNRVVHVPKITSDGGVGWYAELDPIGPGDPTGTDLKLEPRKVAALSTLSNEAVNDSDPSALDATGNAMMRRVALEADRAYFAGSGAAANQPTGILTIAGLPSQVGPVDYANIVTAAGKVRAAGGQPNVAFVNPDDLTALQLAVDGLNRPLLQSDPATGMSETLAGLRLWATPAVPAATALVAQANEVVVALRQDATVSVSADAGFNTDASLVRVIARTDVGVNDINGLCVIQATAGTQESKGKK